RKLTPSFANQQRLPEEPKDHEMYKIFFIFSLMIISSIILADRLNADMVKQIHDQVKNNFFGDCSKNLKDSVIDICRCLANKTEANLDDTALSKCNNDDTGKDCVTKVVKNA